MSNKLSASAALLAGALTSSHAGADALNTSIDQQVTKVEASAAAILEAHHCGEQLKASIDTTQALKQICDQAGLEMPVVTGAVLDQDSYIENPDAKYHSLEDVRESAISFQKATFPKLDNPYQASESDPKNVTNLQELSQLYTTMVVQRYDENGKDVTRSPAVIERIASLQDFQYTPLLLKIINQELDHIKSTLGDSQMDNKNVDQLYFEKAITSAISVFLDLGKQLDVDIEGKKVSEFALGYFNDLTVMMYLLGHISQDDIQVIEIETLGEQSVKNISYVSTFRINQDNKDVVLNTMLHITSKENTARIFTSMNNFNKNIGKISLDGVLESYKSDIQKFSPEVQKLFMEVVLASANQYEGMDLDDFYYELTGVLVLFERDPSHTIQTAKEVSSMFEWDLSKIIAAAERQEKKLNQADEIRELAKSDMLEKVYESQKEYEDAKRQRIDAQREQEEAQAENDKIKQDIRKIQEAKKTIDEIFALINGK